MTGKVNRRQLQRQLQPHVERVEFLRNQIEYMQAEMQVHEALLSMSRDETLLGALDAAFETHEQGWRMTKENVGRFLDARGVPLPSNVRLKDELGDQSVEIRFDSDFYPISVTYTPTSGFTAAPLPPKGRVASEGDQVDVIHG